MVSTFFHSALSRLVLQLASSLAAKTPLGRTFPFLTKRVLPLSRGWHCPQGVLLARVVPELCVLLRKCGGGLFYSDE